MDTTTNQRSAEQLRIGDLLIRQYGIGTHIYKVIERVSVEDTYTGGYYKVIRITDKSGKKLSPRQMENGHVFHLHVHNISKKICKWRFTLLHDHIEELRKEHISLKKLFTDHYRQLNADQREDNTAQHVVA